MSDFKPVNQPITPASADPGEEFPFLHTITVVDRVVSVDKPELVQNNIRTETVTLDLDSEWDGLSCIINIGNDDTPTSLIWSGQPVTIPAELMADIGTLNVSVVGYGDDGALRAVTKKADAMFTVVASGYVEGDEPVPDPTTILGQLTEAADRANHAAQNAEDSTIDKVSVTMLPTGSGASGSVSDKTLSLSIPNGPRGPQGPQGIKGDPGDLTTVTHGESLYGDGTSATPLRVANGTAITQSDTFVTDLNDIGLGIFAFNGRGMTNSPISSYGVVATFRGWGGRNTEAQLVIAIDSFNTSGFYKRVHGTGTEWTPWHQFASRSDIPSDYVPLSTYRALEAKVQALEAKTTYKPITASGTDLHTLFGTNGSYVKMWGVTVTNGPGSVANGTASKYLITVVDDGGDGYMRIDPIAGVENSYYCTKKTSGTVSSWYKITATGVTD